MTKDEFPNPPVVSHKANQCCVPFVDNFGESRGTAGHEDLSHTVMEALHGFIIDTEVALCRAFLGHLILQVPDAVLVREFVLLGAALRQNAAFEAAHGEQ